MWVTYPFMHHSHPCHTSSTCHAQSLHSSTCHAQSLHSITCTHAHVTSLQHMHMNTWPQHGLRQYHWRNTHASGYPCDPARPSSEISLIYMRWKSERKAQYNRLVILCVFVYHELGKIYPRDWCMFNSCYFKVYFVILIYMLSLFLNFSHHL